MTPLLLRISAPTREALEERTRQLVAYLEGDSRPPPQGPDQAYRRVVVAADNAAAVRRLRRGKPTEVVTEKVSPGRPTVFMFSGVGDQYPGMAAGLYRHLAVFRTELDRCFDLLEPDLGRDLRPILYPENDGTGPPTLAALFDRRRTPGEIHETAVAQPLAFATQYALARTLESLRAEPAALLGYSVGEYVAACLAGVFTLEDALRVIALRARLTSGLPRGGMLAVMSAPGPLAPLLRDGLSIAALDGPALTVLAGPAEAIERAGRRLLDEGVASRPLSTTHAFHSPMVEPAAGPLGDALTAIRLSPPRKPVLSNVTGTWLRDDEAVDPGYWARHLHRTIRFADELAEVWRLDRPIPVEVGPGRTLTNLALGHPDRGPVALQTLPGVLESRTDLEVFMTAAGGLWAAGVDIQLPEMFVGARE